VKLQAPVGQVERGARIARITTRIILVLDLLAGIAWLAGDPNRTAVPVFKPARTLVGRFGDLVGLDPARIWGGVLVVLAAVALAAMAGRSEGFTRGVIVLLSGYWTFWLVLDLIAASAPHGSLTAAPTVGIILVGHVRQALGTHLLTRRAVLGD
jgi:hypothetical protein